MSQVIEANADNFEAEVLRADMPVLVDFYATWCGPCQNLAPILENLAEEWAGKIKVVKVNTGEDANMDLALKYQIRNIPNLKIFKDGQAIYDIVGFRAQEELRAEVERAL